MVTDEPLLPFTSIGWNAGGMLGGTVPVTENEPLESAVAVPIVVPPNSTDTVSPAWKSLPEMVMLSPPAAADGLTDALGLDTAPAPADRAAIVAATANTATARIPRERFRRVLIISTPSELILPENVTPLTAEPRHDGVATPGEGAVTRTGAG